MVFWHSIPFQSHENVLKISNIPNKIWLKHAKTGSPGSPGSPESPEFPGSGRRSLPPEAPVGCRCCQTPSSWGATAGSRGHGDPLAIELRLLCQVIGLNMSTHINRSYSGRWPNTYVYIYIGSYINRLLTQEMSAIIIYIYIYIIIII